MKMDDVRSMMLSLEQVVHHMKAATSLKVTRLKQSEADRNQ
jgi:hypothetical protein